jgi:hypothetical protein
MYADDMIISGRETKSLQRVAEMDKAKAYKINKNKIVPILFCSEKEKEMQQKTT